VCLVGALDQRRGPEVGQFNHFSGMHEDVRTLDVPVNHTVAVQVRQPAQHLLYIINYRRFRAWTGSVTQIQHPGKRAELRKFKQNVE
jgi:hypothetical protein